MRTRLTRRALVVVIAGLVGVTGAGIGPGVAGAQPVPPVTSSSGAAVLLDADSGALGINDRGVVVGWYENGGERHAFALSPGGRLTDLGPGTARAINDDGVVVGSAPGPDGMERATWWSPDGEAHDLGLGPWSHATDVNADGVAIGQAQPELAGVFHGYVIPPGGAPRELATPTSLPGTYALPAGIDDRGNVVGDAFDPVTRQSMPVRWRAQGLVAELLPARGTNYGVTGVSDSGTVVGIRLDPSGAETMEAVAWVGRNHRELDLGGPGVGEMAWAINDAGQAVGQEYPGDAPSRAVRWDVHTGTMTVLPAPPSTTGYGDAQAINDRGTVVGVTQAENWTLRATRFTRR